MSSSSSSPSPYSQHFQMSRGPSSSSSTSSTSTSGYTFGGEGMSSSISSGTGMGHSTEFVTPISYASSSSTPLTVMVGTEGAHQHMQQHPPHHPTSMHLVHQQHPFPHAMHQQSSHSHPHPSQHPSFPSAQPVTIHDPHGSTAAVAAAAAAAAAMGMGIGMGSLGMTVGHSRTGPPSSQLPSPLMPFATAHSRPGQIRSVSASSVLCKSDSVSVSGGAFAPAAKFS
ncbi:hypothetical protein DFQ26_004752 [Actinomortierella ambigua]|nr:hypothetical protein DFQ26_004752 [Actinomortierella ambigua]